MSNTASLPARAGLAALAGLLVAQAPPPQPEPDEIVVTAVPHRGCRIRFADRTMTDREFDARAKEWAEGKPVRVVLPAGEGKDCMIKIMFRLADRGAKLVEYVDARDPAKPTPQSLAEPATRP